MKTQRHKHVVVPKYYCSVEIPNLREAEFPNRKEGLQNPHIFTLKICPNPECLFQLSYSLQS